MVALKTPAGAAVHLLNSLGCRLARTGTTPWLTTKLPTRGAVTRRRRLNAGTGTDGYLSPDATSGATILSIPEATRQGATDAKSLAQLMDAVVTSLGGSNALLPGLKSQGAAQPTAFFMSSSNGQTEDWSEAGGSVVSGVGTSSNGYVYVGVAWSSTNDDRLMPKNGTPLSQQLFYSLSPL